MAKIPTQMLKGILENAILLIIAQGETYGYALQQQLAQNGFGNVPEGTIYPLLLKLQQQGWVQGYKKFRIQVRIANIIKLLSKANSNYKFLRLNGSNYSTLWLD